MANPAPAEVLRVACRAVSDSQHAELTDRELLRLHTTTRDENAFRALVLRHGPMVMAVCRSVLSHEADAEDAFQATFLVFVRKSGSVRKAASLASWLHGVAFRVARRARANSATRREREQSVAVAVETLADDFTWREVQQVIHEELSGLSERHRTPLTLCYLQGRTLDQAATEIGLATSTLKVRLERARAILRARLVRRGLGPIAVLLTSAWPATGAVLPAELLEATIKTATSASASAGVVALSQGVLNTMRITNLKLAAATLTVLTAVGLSLGGLAHTSTDPGGEAKGKSACAPLQDAQKPDVPKVVREKVKDRHGDDWVRITGRVKVIDSRTLEYDDGKRIEMWIIAPRLDQMAMDGEKLYPAGREAADFLRKAIGDRPVTCLHEAGRNQYAVTAYAGDTSLNELMVVNGWAFSTRIPSPSEFAAREYKRGLWRGQFTDPTDWEAGVRLPGEPPPPKIADEREAHRLIKTYHERKAAMPALLDRIVRDVPDVRVLNLNSARLTNDALAKLAGLKSLEELSLGGHFTDDGIRHLKGLASLKKLDLYYTTVTDAGIEHLAQLTGLEDLTLTQQLHEAKVVRITDAGLKHLKGLKKLRRLDLTRSHVTDAFLEHLGTLTDLEQLHLDSTPVTDAGVKHLKGLKKLRHLTLSSTAITDTGLGHLSSLTNLEVLELGGTRITNAGLPHLKGFANLAYLDIDGNEVTDAGLEHLWGLKKLQVADLPHHISDQAWKRFKEAVPTVTGSSFPKRPVDYLTNSGGKEE